jgi:hypothetical protein
MTVTRDVILDLLPLYFAGQVSADTKTLVDEFLRTDPDFARMSQRFDTLLKAHGTPADGGAAERRAFERTRRLLKTRNHTIGMAVAYSLLPFAFMFQNGHVTWIMMRDKPSIAAAFAFTALACWVAAWIINRRAVTPRS